jgi:RimJ/RimL family protein N-acetyltransferase
MLIAQPLRSQPVTLEPLRVSDAEELAPLLGDDSLYRFIGGASADVDELRSRFARQVRGVSPDGREVWLNWIVRTGPGLDAAGTLQATVSNDQTGPVAELAWVIGTAHQGQGLAKAAAGIVAGWLSSHGVTRLRAHIHPEHAASQAVAISIGLRPTPQTVDGEQRWQSPEPGRDEDHRR